jgi:hypothetical protein
LGAVNGGVIALLARQSGGGLKTSKLFVTSHLFGKQTLMISLLDNDIIIWYHIDVGKCAYAFSPQSYRLAEHHFFEKRALQG